MLFILKDAKPKLRKAILKYCNEDVIKAITEIVINILHGNLNVNNETKKKLKKYKKQLRTVATPSKNYTTIKRKAILQHGGSFLPTVIGLLLSSVLSEFTRDA